MRKAEFQIEWRRYYDTEPPQISPSLMRMGIAYRIQEKAYGGPSRTTKAKLRRIAGGEAVGSKPIGKLKPGSRLVRTWNGKTVVVHVMDGDFLFEDKRYRSLSEVARKVTGAHWSAPRFFGLIKPKADPCGIVTIPRRNCAVPSTRANRLKQDWSRISIRSMPTRSVQGLCSKPTA